MDGEKTTGDASFNKANLGLLGAVGAAVVASACCLGPLVLVSLGVTGAWIGSLSELQPYRPIFMAVAVGFLGLAFYRVYRPQGEACEPKSACARPKTKLLTKASLWVVTALVITLFTSPYFIGRLAAGTGESQPVSTDTITLKVENMTCDACPVTVRKSLMRIDGVVDARVTLNPPEAVVEFDPVKLTPKDLTEATASVGYPSELVAGRSK